MRYLKNILYFSFFFLTITLILPVFADENTTSNMKIIQEKATTDKKFLVSQNMRLTEEEAKAFWPIYKAYQKDLNKITERLNKAISDYAVVYHKGALSNETAKKLLEEAIDIELEEVKLKQTYVPKLNKVLPSTKVALYIQMETKIRAIERYVIAQRIPLVH